MTRVPDKWIRDNYTDEQIIEIAPEKEKRVEKLELHAGDSFVSILEGIGGPPEAVYIEAESYFGGVSYYAVYEHYVELTNDERLEMGIKILKAREQYRRDKERDRERRLAEYKKLKREFESDE